MDWMAPKQSSKFSFREKNHKKVFSHGRINDIINNFSHFWIAGCKDKCLAVVHANVDDFYTVVRVVWRLDNGQLNLKYVNYY